FFARERSEIEKIDSLKIRRGDRKCLCAKAFVHPSLEIIFALGLALRGEQFLVVTAETCAGSRLF
ncbi:MAG TPA: hypothetical protein VN754_00275, partial [Candidatus Binataceae bacterium]|nr:hypothetical protein [Candidatus Binataceae bacterium]